MNKRESGKKAWKYWMIPIALYGLFIGFCLITGGKRSDVFLNKYTVTEDGGTIVLDVGVAGSTGYTRTLELDQKEKGLYLTFYSTYGLNSSLGAEHIFPVSLASDCEKIYFYTGDGEWKQVLAKNSAGEWQKVNYE